MKRIVLLVSVIVLIVVSIVLCFVNNNVLKSNQKYYDYFKEEKLVGVDGEINLVGVSTLRDELLGQVQALFSDSSYDYFEYLNIIDIKSNDNKELQNDIDILVKNVSDLESKKKSLDSEYSVLYSKYQKLKNNKDVASNANSNNISNFPLINQNPKYPTGCESVALTMLLQYYGVNVTPDMVIALLKRGGLPYWENSQLYGGNPELEFIGNPYSSSSYGVYEKPIADVANKFKSGINVKNNFSFNEVVNLVQGGTPVMVWTSIGLSLPYISNSWIYKPTMEVVDWKANEHAVVVIGVNDNSVIIADPLGGRKKTYSRSLFESRYNYYGKKALYY